MKPFKIRENNIELRSCSNNLSSKEPHTKAEIVRWFDVEGEELCCTIAVFRPTKEGFDLYSIGERPFDEAVNPETFWCIAKRGFELLNKGDYRNMTCI